MCGICGGKIRTGVVGVSAPGKDLEELQGRLMFGAAEGLDGGFLEELGEDVGVWCGGCLGDQIGGGAGRSGGFGEDEKGLEGVEGALLLHICIFSSLRLVGLG